MVLVVIEYSLTSSSDTFTVDGVGEKTLLNTITQGEFTGKIK